MEQSRKERDSLGTVRTVYGGVGHWREEWDSLGQSGTFDGGVSQWF